MAGTLVTLSSHGNVYLFLSHTSVCWSIPVCFSVTRLSVCWISNSGVLKGLESASQRAPRGPTVPVSSPSPRNKTVKPQQASAVRNGQSVDRVVVDS